MFKGDTMKKDKTLKIIFFAIAALLLLYNAAMLIINGYALGLLVTFCYMVGFFLYGLFWEKLKRFKVLNIICICAVIVPVILSIALYSYGSHDNVRYDEDAAIVLGSGIQGESVPPSLQNRLNKAVEYTEKNPKAVIVVSGGQGRDEVIPEALAMERYLLEKGVAKEKIIKEDKSTSTYENFSFSQSNLNERFPNGFSVAFVTSDYHVFRANLVAKSMGFEVRHLGAKILWYTAPLNYLREILANGVYIIRCTI